MVGVAVKVTDSPVQMVLSASLDVMVTLTGWVGFTVTSVVEVAWQLLASVTVTVYVPDAGTVAFAMDGFCRLYVNEFGPVQE